MTQFSQQDDGSTSLGHLAGDYWTLPVPIALIWFQKVASNSTQQSTYVDSTIFLWSWSKKMNRQSSQLQIDISQMKSCSPYEFYLFQT